MNDRDFTPATRAALNEYERHLYGHQILTEQETIEMLAAMLIADIETAVPGSIEDSKDFMP